MLEEIGRTLLELCERGPTDEEIARAQRRHRMFLEFASDSPGELAGYFGSVELFRPPESFEARCQQVERETRQSVRDAARKYFRPERLGLVAVGQRKGHKALEKLVERGLGL